MRRATLIASFVLTALALAAAGSDGPAKRKAPAKRPKRAGNGAMAPIKDTPDLPRVLLIGDSISIGYTLPTRKLLAGTVNLHRIPTNGGDTGRGLEALDEWLGKGTWDVIHFNWGLHDLKHFKDGKLDASGTQVRGVADYEKNLRELVGRLKKTGAKLIWCSTTPVPEGAGGRVQGDAARYNAAAATVMKELGVPTDDLYAFALPRLKEIQQPRNVHFTPAGSQALARQVANSILKALGKDPLPEPATRPAKEQ
ncbi:MAG TPA: SGNH/GDSL hydrolase family protein [Phycisphaerae bacterium]|nr:SGNH/GDSL hydrolase family protein [Phycisphaerae bacterium]